MAKKSSASSQPAQLISWSSDDIRNRKMTDQEIQALQRIATRQQDPNYDYVANDPLTPDQLANMVRFRDVPRKVAVSVRLDPQVLTWLKSKGGGHLTRINDILVNLMEAESRSR